MPGSLPLTLSTEQVFTLIRRAGVCFPKTALTGLRTLLCFCTFICIQTASSLKHTSLQWESWTGTKISLTHAHAPHHHLRRRRSLILPAQDLVSVIKFLCSFSVAQFTLPGLLASQALHLACCPPGFVPASQHPAPPVSSGMQSGLLKAPVLLESGFIPSSFQYETK